MPAKPAVVKMLVEAIGVLTVPLTVCKPGVVAVMEPAKTVKLTVVVALV